ncbi:hypothetical protein [uncultured Rothia sp.]|uniref:hypothetical protein n=1 Tax=uncultured Rothia sp. TaxID=316088 RepID=UPI0032179180
MPYKASGEYTDTSTAAIEMDPQAPPPPQWSKADTSWSISLFGRAIGAGILFLPINAGSGGVWPLLIATVIIWPHGLLFPPRSLTDGQC